jgi:hypothetical protein
MAETHNNRRQAAKRVSGRRGFGTNGAPRYQQGDYLRIELLSGVVSSSMSIWMYVDHCDDKHAIVFGTIDTEPCEWLGHPLSRGAKLAVSYRQVREHRQSE